MSGADKLELVIEAIRAATGLVNEKIDADSWLVRDLGVQSLDFLEIAYALEVRLGRTVDFRKVFRHAGQTPGSEGDVRVADIFAYVSSEKMRE